MKIETLKKSKLKYFLCALVLGALLLILLDLKGSLAKYKVTESIKIVEGNINYSPADLSIMAIYVEEDDEYVDADAIPENDYIINQVESYCTVNGNVIDNVVFYDNSTQTFKINLMTNKGTKCYLYFDKTVCDTYGVSTTLGTLNINDCEPTFSYSSYNVDTNNLGICTYKGEVISSSAEISDCANIYEVYSDGTISYMTHVLWYLISDLVSYVGEAIWDEETASCTYNGYTLVDINGNAITSKEYCTEAYQSTMSSEQYFSAMKNIGPGKWYFNGDGKTGIYAADDDDGTSYYYRGAVENNYVKFAGFYWRIIRINGDGSIRLIYDGTTARSNGTASEDTQIGTSAFNDTYDSIDFVGFMYTVGSVRGNATSSTIKGVLDTWYANNLASYSSYIDTSAGFCGDRQAYGNLEATTEGTSWTAAYIRIANHAPSFKCIDSRDLYTVSSSGKGNKALTYPIGLITSDEALYAGVGGYGIENKTFYLYTGQSYWTMSPASSFTGIYVSTFGGFEDGGEEVTISHRVRPVINLRADVTLTGSGTSTDPYVVS